MNKNMRNYSWRPYPFHYRNDYHCAKPYINDTFI